MKISPPLELIRENRNMYLGNHSPCGRVLAIRLAECALMSGAHRVEVMLLNDGWAAVSGDTDWITPNLLERQKDASIDRAFSTMIPLFGGQQNEIRFEIVVAAFSKHLSVKTGELWRTIEGDSLPEEVRDIVSNSEFAVVFKPEMDS
jgi:hypothetical protein